VQRLSPLLEAFAQEIAGVKAAQDSEYIHRMRVASRRLRAALPLFTPCFAGKKYRRWMQEIKKITRALGEARDADVQIVFLRKCAKKEAKKGPAADGSGTDIQDGSREVEQELLAGLEKKRAVLQKEVLAALFELERSRVVDDMRYAFGNLAADAGKNRIRPRSFGIPAVASSRIGSRLALLLSYGPWVHNPDAVAEHHATRIAAKKLRYTMEVYAPVYMRGLKKPLARVKKIQEVLGDLHDCDVWIDTVTLMLLEERSRMKGGPGSKRGGTRRVTGLKRFLSEREKERKLLYRRFVALWDTLMRSGLWEELSLHLAQGLIKQFRVPDSAAHPSTRSAVHRFSAVYPDGIRHCRKVTELALALFDSLAPLHHLHERERLFLEYAGLLHDIGWKYGQKGHAMRSREMIISDEDLPLSVTERGIIGLVAGAHRGKVRLESGGLFSLLSPADRHAVMVLAAILRIADGLDILHQDSVQSVACTIYPEEIALEVRALRDASCEKERAAAKADLFRQVFERELVIS
jgi:CHAD domain-containing protein